MHRINDNSQNACFPVLQKWVRFIMRGIIGAGMLIFLAGNPQTDTNSRRLSVVRYDERL